MDFRKRSNWTVRLLYLQIAISVIGIITGTMEYGVLSDMRDGNFASEAEMMQVAEANDARQATLQRSAAIRKIEADARRREMPKPMPEKQRRAFPSLLALCLGSLNVRLPHWGASGPQPSA